MDSWARSQCSQPSEREKPAHRPLPRQNRLAAARICSLSGTVAPLDWSVMKLKKLDWIRCLEICKTAAARYSVAAGPPQQPCGRLGLEMSPQERSAAPLSFSAEEWLVIFPDSAPSAAAALFEDRLPLSANGDDRSPDDIESEQSDPITFEKWIRAASEHGGGWLAWQERAVNSLSPWIALGNSWVPGVLHSLGVVCVMPIPFILDTAGTFGQTQLIAGTFNLGFFIVSNTVVSLAMHWASKDAPPPRDIHLMSVKQLWRLWQLQGAPGAVLVADTDCDTLELDQDGVSGLVAHREGDSLCPCRNCVRSLVRWIPWERFLRSLGLQLPVALYMSLMRWTALVFLGGIIWSRAWGAILGTLSLLTILQYSAPSFWRTFVGRNDPFVRICTRVYRRATYLSLRSFVSRAAAALADPVSGLALLPAQELFVELHRGYASRWSAFEGNATEIAIASSLATMYVPMCLAWLVVSVSTGYCIPGWILVGILWFPVFIVLTLFGLPSINGQMDAVSELYRSAHLSLSSLLSEAAGLPPSPQRDAVQERVRARAVLLQGLAGSAEHHRIRFWGLPVTYGLAKTVAVTLLTLIVGGWGIMRGFGTFVTLQTYCPLQPS
ncbi:hypothetical protein DFJ74DRAFT_306027 [Hyaloraphidium curvatum]|nr:hypothetical protein DFJ74DRAFT_306027 [Hyaloraphidium curvatum]